MSIEAFTRLAFPEIHRRMPEMWDVLTDAPSQILLGFGTEGERNERRRRIAEWLDSSGSRADVEPFIEALFPGVPSFAKGGSEPTVEYAQEASGRIASAMNFNRYFLYRAELDDVPNPDADRVVVAAASGVHAAAEALRGFLHDHRAKGRRAIDRLSQRAQAIEADAAVALGDALVQVSPDLSTDRDFLDVSQWERSQIVLWNLANRVPEPAGLITTWVREAPQLDYAIRLVAFLNPERNRVFTRWTDVDLNTFRDDLESRIAAHPETFPTAQYRLHALRLFGQERASAICLVVLDAGVVQADDIIEWFMREAFGFGGDELGPVVDPNELRQTFGIDGVRALASRGGDQGRFADVVARALDASGSSEDSSRPD